MKIYAPVILASSLFSSIASASNCDHALLNIVGPSHYGYSINLTDGSIDEKNNQLKSIQEQVIAPQGNAHYVFAARGTLGSISGTVTVNNSDTKQSVIIPFRFFEKKIDGCEQSFAQIDWETDSYQVHKQKISKGIILKIREFK